MRYGGARPVAATRSTTGPFGSRRRRLWELPTQAHELLLSLTFTPDALRREVARALGRLHRARCQLDGSDADLLYAAMHDLTTRNALSEALQRRLDECHALPLRRWAPLRGTAALRAAWQAARASGAPAGELWAALTHPEGAALDAQVLREARFLVLGCARIQRDRAAAAAEWQRRALAAEDTLREARAAAVHSLQEAAQARSHLQRELAAALGEGARWRARAEALADALAQARATPGVPASAVAGAEARADASTGAVAHTAPGARATAAATSAEAAPAKAAEGPGAAGPDAAGPDVAALAVIARPVADVVAEALPRHGPAITGQPPSQAQGTARATQGAQGACFERPAPARAGAAPCGIDGRQVLCVGGIRRAVARYRSRVERLGAGFEHHDGGVEEGVASLEGRLQRADVVICQAGCINHEAYQRIKRHCERTGKPCVYLERPSLAHFDRALASLAPSDACRRGLG